MHHVGGVGLEESGDAADARQRDADVAIAGPADGGDVDHGSARDGVRSTGRLGGDDDRLVAAGGEVIEHSQQRVGDAVRVRQERLCDQRDLHDCQSSGRGRRRGCRVLDVA
ncbi:hypothetical protein GCM10025873_04010 [Demequina sediminis]|nr:hypothetical protein GCM10025873_04010 [Demequina sediminis]